MTTWSKTTTARWVILISAAFVYFVAYPRDLASVIFPVKEVLALSNAISPWLYGLIAVAILAWTATAIWGGRTGRAAS